MNFPKSTYEYWVKRFDRLDRDEELAKEIGRIKEEIQTMDTAVFTASFRKLDIRLISRKYIDCSKNIIGRSHHLPERVVNITPIEAKERTWHPTGSIGDSSHAYRIRR